MQQEADRINGTGDYNRTPRQIDAAVTNVTDWIWEKFVEGQKTEDTDRSIELRLPTGIYELIQTQATATQDTVAEYVTRVVLADLAAKTLNSAELTSALLPRA